MKIWAYQAKRLFCDCLVGKDSIEKFDNILTTVIRNDWSISLENLNNTYYVTWGSSSGTSHTGNVVGSFGRPLGMLSKEDFKEVVSKALVAYGECSNTFYSNTHTHQLLPRNTIQVNTLKSASTVVSVIQGTSMKLLLL